MSSGHHIIRRYTFEVQFSARAKAAVLQDRVSSLFQHRLTTDMEQLLQQLLPDNMVAVLDTLELDLGTILYKDMDTQLPARILEALEKALSGILHTGMPGQHYQLTGRAQVKTGDERLFELLEHYLLAGVMPWWATAEEREQPDLAVLHLTGVAPARLAALLRQLAQQEYVRKRIAWQFSMNAILQVVTVLEPAEAAFIFEYSREVLHLQQQQQLLQTESKTLERAVWLFVLTYLVTEGGSNFSRKQFVRSHLTQMAHHFNVDYETLLQLFYDALGFYKQDIPVTTIGGFIKTLYGESGLSTTTRLRRYRRPAAGDDGYAALLADPAEQVALLRYYLLFGSFPWWAPQIAINVLYEALLLTAQKAAAPLKEMLALVLQEEQSWKRWTGLFDHTRRETLIRLLEDKWISQANELFITRPRGFDHQVPESAAPMQLRDVLLYRLLYGSIPWWGRTYAHFSINSLLQQLMDQFAPAAITVFKYAGTLPYAMERFLSALTPALFFSVARSAGITDTAYTAYETVYALLQAVHRHIVSGVGSQVLQQQLLKAFWQVWAETGYGHFSVTAFTERAVQLWSATTGILSGSLLFLMKSALPAIEREGATQQWLVTHLQQLINAWKTEGVDLYYTIAAAWVPNAVRSAHPLIHFIRNNRAPVTGAEREQAGQTIIAWLRHFVEEGKFPASAGIFTQQETIWLAGKMLEWAYANYKERLPDLRAVIQPLPVVLNRLFNLWLILGDTPTPMRELMAVWMEQVLAPPEAGTMVVMDGLWQVIPEQQASPVAEPRLNLPAHVSRLLHRFQQYDIITSAAEKQQWLEQATQLLTYFLTWHKLPDQVSGISATTANELLKQAVILLFRQKPAALHNLFSIREGSLSARLQVYHLFTPPAGPLEHDIRQSLDVYAVQDSLLLLQETAGHAFTGAAAGFREAVRFYKQQGKQERAAFYKRIFRYPVLVTYAAQQLDDTVFLDMMEDIDLGWGHPATTALHELQQLFDRLITDSLEREKIKMLFREFHIMLLAGHFSVHNATAYASRFLEFLMSAGTSVVRNFIARLAGAHEKISITSYTHIRNILPPLQQNAVRYAQSHLYMEDLQHNLYEIDQQLIALQRRSTPPPATLPAVEVKKAEPVYPPEPAGREWEQLRKPEPDTIYVNNAGLVLLYPFLTTAFQRLGLLQAGQFVNREAQIRAIHLLQYTVNGQAVHPEHELALNKVLCNLPLEEPVPPEIILTEEEKQLTREMLKVVLQQWEKMKNTTIEGFQGAFLQREGALWETEEAWFLRVEQRGYDVILQTLPWSVGTVRISWMDKILYTEWVYT